MVFEGCLSRMRGNLHVRFLGEGVAARPPPYPTDAVSSILIARSRINSFRPLICKEKSQQREVGFFVVWSIYGHRWIEPDQAASSAAAIKVSARRV